MFNTIDAAPVGFNPATNFLQNSFQQNMAAGVGGQGLGFGMGGGQNALQGQFTNVLNSMQAGVTTNAQMGNIGNQATSQMTPQQVAAQMHVGGVMSVLPHLGGSFLPKLMFPIAGLWSLVSGVKAIGDFIVGARHEGETHQKFDPSQLAYNTQMNEMYEVSQKWSNLGPMTISQNPYGY